ncbi:hypothetical protein [Paenibacillus chungangensis]|uniref:Cardiolipin synthase N-terminal domain-containing protein n=1 Tax=Paenibacillus chungangensis TaxID=696535 RepID=A0ABW3HSS0_9BACL
MSAATGSVFGFGVILVFIFFALFLLNIATSVWAYRDAKRMGKSSEFAILVLIGTLIFPIVGLIVYVLIRKY